MYQYYIKIDKTRSSFVAPRDRTITESDLMDHEAIFKLESSLIAKHIRYKRKDYNDATEFIILRPFGPKTIDDIFKGMLDFVSDEYKNQYILHKDKIEVRYPGM